MRVYARNVRTMVLQTGVIWCLICSGDKQPADRWGGWNAHDASRVCPLERNCRTINADTRARYLIKKKKKYDKKQHKYARINCPRPYFHSLRVHTRGSKKKSNVRRYTRVRVNPNIQSEQRYANVLKRTSSTYCPVAGNAGCKKKNVRVPSPTTMLLESAVRRRGPIAANSIRLLLPRL